MGDDWKPEDGAGYIPTEGRSHTHIQDLKDDLRELADQWEEIPLNEMDHKPRKQLMGERAQELRELLEDNDE